MNRRTLLKTLGGAAATLPLWRPAGLLAADGRRRSIRLAQVTDVHLEPEMGAVDGLTQCLHHLQAQPDPAELILMTGDCVFDAFSHDHARVKLLWDLWQKTWKGESSLPVRSLLGNHDIFGWNKPQSHATGREPDFGKKWACDALGLGMPYYSFDQAGWHFVALDSVQSDQPLFDSGDFTCKLDEAQFDWLEKDLAATHPNTPVLVMSHVPILSIAAIFGKASEQPQGTLVKKEVMHTDWRRIKSLFAKHPNVKLAVSGHLHLNDRVDYAGVSYLCNGAVCGGWWKEPNLGEGDAGYTLIDLYDDGSFDHRFVTYGWKYRTPEPDAAAK